MLSIVLFVACFYVVQLLLPMIFSLHKVPFKNFTHVGGDKSKLLEISSRAADATKNFHETLPVFFALALLSLVFEVDNTQAACIWLYARIAYYILACLNLFTYPYLRPAVWLVSIGALACMGINLFDIA